MKPVALKEGIILKTTDYKDQAVLVNVLTPNGLENFIIKGAKKISGGTRLLANALSKIVFSCTESEGLNTIIEGSCKDNYITIKSNIDKMLNAYAIMEKILTFSSQVTNNDLFYHFVEEILDLLSSDLSEDLVVILFDIKLTFLIGIGPELKHCVKCGKSVDNGVFSIYNGGCFCRSCKIMESYDLNEEETKALTLLYLIKLKMVDKKLEAIVKDNLKKLLWVIDLYYQKHLDFTSKAKIVMKEMHN